MNKVYNVIWSEAQKAWVVVAEGTKRRSKSAVNGLKVIVALIMLSPGAGMATTLPQGGVISVGEGTIINSGSDQVIIKQNTDKLGINWQSFNVGADGRVVFDQPSATSVALNRVVGSDGSSILGKIDANGQVILINPNGVMFGKDAQVNVGGLVASTLDLSDKDFKDGNYTFTGGTNAGAVINNGSLQAAEGGYVALIGKNVKNQGLIKATLGTAAMAAGDSVTLDMSGDGLINLQVNKAAVGAMIDNQGMIVADGGQALLSARAANALTETVINNDGIIQAQTISKKSGKIILDGGPVDGEGIVMVGGTLDTSAPVAGNGGFIDTSAMNVTVKDGAKITTASKSGKTGSWIIDPTDFRISYGAGAQTTSSIGITTLQNALANSNVEIATQSSSTQVGNITVGYDLTWSADTVLTLTAHNNISTDYAINVNGKNGGLVLNYGGSLNLSSSGGSGKINLAGDSSTLVQNGVNYTVIRNLTDLQNAQSDLSGHYAIGVNIDASASSSLNGGLGFDPLGDDTSKFTGSIYGLGHTISGLTINRPTEDYVGLVGYGSGNVVKDLELINANISGQSYVGAIAGVSENSDIIRVKARGTVSGGGYVGGLFGDIQTPTNFSWSSYDGTVNSGGSLVGGIAGRLNGSAYYLSTSGSVTGLYWAGGIAGNALGTLRDSYSTAAVKGDTYVGGLVGYANKLNTYNTYAKGAVTAKQSGGGLIGYAMGGSSIATSFSTSSVSSGGGLVGTMSSSSIKSSYATGNVVGTGGGGLVGSLSSSTVENSYSTGKAAQGLIGYSSSSTVTGSFWDMTSSGASSSNGGVGKTSAEMQLASTFDGWSIDTTGLNQTRTWRIYEGHTAPLLTFMMPDMTPSGLSATYTGEGILAKNSINSYGGTAKVFWGTPGSDLAFEGQTLKSGGVEVVDAGTYSIDQLYSNQFGWNIRPASLSLTVAKKTLSYGTGSFSKVYDGTTYVDPSVLFLTNVYSGDDVSILAPDMAYASKDAASNVRVNYGTIQLSGSDAGNYVLPFGLSSGIGGSNGNIQKRLISVSGTGIDKTYDGTVNGSMNLNLGNIVAGDIVTGSATSTKFLSANAGANIDISATGLTLGGADAGNYSIVGTVWGKANINKASLAINAVAADKTYDGSTDASLTKLTAKGIGSEIVTISGGTAEFADKNAGEDKVVNVYGYTISGSAASNYTWTNSVATTADISKANLSVSASASDKVYDGTTQASVTFTDNRLAGDDLAFSSASSTFIDKNAGDGKVVSVTGIQVTGADADNYAWNVSDITSADIAKADLNLSVSGVDKVYDGNTAAGVSFSDSRVAGDDLAISYGSATFSDKNAGDNKVVTVGGITASGADAGNYNFVSSLATTASISKALLDVTASAVSKTYDGSASTDATLLDNRVAGDDLTVSYGSATFDSKNAGAGKTVTVDGINISGADAANYTLDTSSETALADIAAKKLTVTATGNDKVYDGSTAATVSSLVDDRIAGDDLSIASSGAAFADKNAGDGKTLTATGITVTGADALNYYWDADAVGSASIAKAQLQITSTAAGKNYDGTTVATVILADDRIAGDKLTLGYGSALFDDKNAGLAKTVEVTGLTVTGVDAGNYEWNVSSSTAADVGRAVLTVGANGIGKTYDGTTHADVTFTDDRFGSDDLVISADDVQFVDKNAALNKQISVSGISVTGADADNYIWGSTTVAHASINKAALGITATAADKVYDGLIIATTTLADNRIAGDKLTVSKGSSVFSDKNAGAGKTVTVNSITVTGEDAKNYTWAPVATTTADIAKARLEMIAAVETRSYDGTTDATAHIAYDTVAGDALTVTYGAAKFADKNAGDYKDVSISGISVTGAESGNYEWDPSLAAHGNIQQASLEFTASAQDKVYDGSSFASAELVDNRFGADDLVITSTGASFADKNAADGKLVTVNGINVTGADAGNYTWSTSTTTTADISKASLTVAATAADKVYDGSVSASTALTDNRIGSDDLIVSGGASQFSDKNAGESKDVVVSGIAVIGADALNYTWNEEAAATANISKAQLDITAAAASKDYDSTTNADVFLSDNRVSGDSLAFSHSQANFDNKNAGSGKTVTVSDIELSGADAGNYTWNSTASTTADIGRAVLSITAAGVDKTYDGTVDASATFLDNRLGSDDLVVSADTISFIDKDAASGKQISISGIAVTGADAGNYIWDTTGVATADIAKANLSVTATAAGKTYDGTTAVVATIGDNRFGTDDLIITSTAAFADKNAGSSKLVNVDGINVTGADAGNYTWNVSATTTADIAKASLQINAAASNKTYDGSKAAESTLTDNRIAGDDLTISSANSEFTDKNAGTLKVVTVNGIVVSGADAANYEWNTAAVTLADISKANLVVSAIGQDKTYDGTVLASTTLTDNRIGGDDLVLTSAGSSFADKNAGAGKIVTVNGVTVSGADAQNYNWNTVATATAAIAKASLVVSAAASDKVYDGSTAASASLSDNRIGSDSLNLNSASANFSDKNAGDEKVVTVGGITVTGADAQNYAWNSVATATADIAKAELHVTAGAASKDYDTTRDASVVFNDDRIAGDNLSISAEQAWFDTKDAGIGKNVAIDGIYVTGADASNYVWNSYAEASADIGKAILSITATGVDKTYDGTTVGDVILSDNRLGSDDLVLSASDVQFIDKNAATGKQMSVSGIAVSGADAANYIWDSSVVATGDINKAVLNVTATASDKAYDGTKAVTTTISDNRIGSDDLAITASAEFADKNAGLGKLVNVDGITVSGVDAGNYVWNETTSTTADIAKAHLDITTGAVSRDYDGTTQATAVLSDNRIAGDSLSLSYGQAAFADKNAGMAKDVTVSDIAVTGADAGNYTWETTSSATADIGRAVLSINATGVNKTYDGNTDATATFTDNRFGSDDLTIGADEAKYVDKNAASGKQISISGITVTGADASNYIWDATAVATADITKASLSVSAVAGNKVYDGNTEASTSLTDNRVQGDDLVLSSTSSSFDTKNAGTGKVVSIDGINVTGADAINYTWNTEVTTTAEITKANLVVDATGVNKTYDSTTSASAALSDNRILGDNLSISYGDAQFSDKNAGTGKLVTVDGINVTGADAGNYTWNVTDTATANIDKATLLVTAAGVDKIYDGSTSGTVVLSDSRFANDDLSISASGVAFVDKNAGAGKAVSVDGITVTGADAQNYTWNTSAATTADIAKAALTVSAIAQDKVYDTTTAANVGFADNRVAGDQLTVSGSGAFSDKNAGYGKTVAVNGISVTGADAGNYTWNSLAVAVADITKANLVVSAVANDKTYDGATAATTSLSDNRLAGDDLVTSSATSDFTDKNAGSNKGVTVSGISVTGADAGNYAWNESASANATINKAILTVTGSAADKTYDGNRDALVSLSDNRIGSDNLVITSSSATFASKDAGQDKLVSIDGIAVAGADASNYTWNSTAESTADIAKATLVVTANAQDKTYNGNTDASTTLSDNRIAGDSLVVDSTGAAFSDKNAGAGKLVTVDGISISGADADNYIVASTATTTASINKALLNIVADAAGKTYDGSTSTTATLSDDRVAGDLLTLRYGSASFSDKNAGSGKSVSVSDISISGADAMNYVWNTSATGTASIAKANLAITASGINKVYDGSTVASADLEDNRVAGDQLTLSAGSVHFSDKNAGASKAVAVTGISVTGADAANYVWDATAATTADIAKRDLQVTAAGVNKTYDGTTEAVATLADNRVSGDNLVVTSSGASFDNKNAGSAKAISVDGIMVTGADADNYTWSSAVATTADVLKAQLTVTATAANKVYNGTTEALSTYSDDRLAGDNLIVTAASSTFEDKNAGLNKTVNVSGITLAGTDAENYTVNSVAVATASIDRAALTVGATGTSKVYDGSTAATVALTDNRIAGDKLDITSSAAAYADKNAGTSKAVSVDGITVGGGDAGNYTWNSSTTAVGTIEKANLVVSGVVQDKVYDGSTSAIVNSLTDNRVIGDDLVVSAGGASFLDKNAGSNKTAVIDGVSVAGADAGNYNWDSVSITAAEIVKAYLQLAATGQNKSYDGTSQASVSVTDNRIAGDQVVVNVGTALFDDKNAGLNKGITASDLTLTGSDAGNYTIADSLTAHADISKADLTIGADEIKKVKGQQDPTLTWKVKDGTLFTGDSLTGSLTRAAGEDAGIYAVEQGTLDAGGNYNLRFAPGALTITDTPQRAPDGYEKAVSAVKKGPGSLPGFERKELVELSLGYNMINLGIKLPEAQLGDTTSNTDSIEIFE